MQELNIPTFEFRYKSEDNKTYVFDEIRKRYVALTAEEWVRQNFVKMLIYQYSYPAGRIGIEKQLILNSAIKRSDIVVYTPLATPFMVVECKAPSVPLDQNVVDQIAHYNMTLKSKYLIITNGMEILGCELNYENSSYKMITQLPNYKTENVR